MTEPEKADDRIRLVINDDYGGFGLSEKAIKTIARRKGMRLLKYEMFRGFFFGSKEKAFVWRRADRKTTLDPLDHIKNANDRSRTPRRSCVFLTEDIGRIVSIDAMNEYKSRLESEGGPTVIIDNWSSIRRDDPDLITVIEKLGLEKAGSPHSVLKMISIPKGSYYIVVSYDGKESCYYSETNIHIAEMKPEDKAV